MRMNCTGFLGLLIKKEEYKMIKVITKKIVNEGMIESVVKLYGELVNASRNEKGCIEYELYQDKKDSYILVVVEEWESDEALKNHKDSEHFKRIVPMIGKLTSSKVDSNVYKKIF